ncbi:MAG: hypothetical protein JW901_10070 [Dehalococcoidia bacterium]|nr:hypothetical protein [Dehalococcoidia bacterium]
MLINSCLTFYREDTLPLSDLEYNPEHDARLIVITAEKHPRDTACFYGGEPFLAPDKMDRVRLLLSKTGIGSRVRYVIYTTGEFIDRYLNKYPDLIQGMWLYSIFIDGSHKQHEQVRPGTSLSKTINSLKKLRRFYRGYILAWSTLRKEQSLLDCFHQFMEMHCCGLADHFFWHWADSRQPLHDFETYYAKYREELEVILQQYISWFSEGEIPPIPHLNELVTLRIEDRQCGRTARAVELARNYNNIGRHSACLRRPAALWEHPAVKVAWKYLQIGWKPCL